jgi:hypothetical protein
MPQRRKSIIAHPLIWTLYGHWLPNDLRGSGSTEFRDEKLASLGPIHTGRKPNHLQPTRRELRAFQKQAEPLLDHRRFWIDDAKRQAIADAFAATIRVKKCTVWACAILSNHAHMVVRRHRDDGVAFWQTLADAAAISLRAFTDVGAEHPVWSTRPCKVYLYSPDDVWRLIA